MSEFLQQQFYDWGRSGRDKYDTERLFRDFVESHRCVLAALEETLAEVVETRDSFIDTATIEAGVYPHLEDENLAARLDNIIARAQATIAKAKGGA